MVGFGGVGQRVAGVLKGFSCGIQYYDPYLTQSPHPDYAPRTLEDIFMTSDIVSVHLPVTEETKGLIGERLLNLMKPGAILVNSARASVIERDALLGVLKEKRIAGAILDVFYHEPPDESDYELIMLPNVYATPHIAGASYEVDDHSAVMMNAVLEQWFVHQNRNIRQLANPQAVSAKGPHNDAS
jgi:D-3-phosphoglycerate dehydrogenase